MDTTKKSTSLRLDSSLYEDIKKQARKENRSINNYIETILYEALEREPNEETKKAIKEAEDEFRDLKQYNTAEEIFNDL